MRGLSVWCVTVVALGASSAACFSDNPASPRSLDAAASPDVTLADDAGGQLEAGPISDAGTVTLVREAGAPVSPFAFGQNYWDWVDWSNTGVTGLTGTEATVTALHLNLLRAGGNNNDTNSPQAFDTAQIDKYVAYCRTVGAEPVLQVPIIANPADGGAATEQTAADMVTYANVTKGYGIKYWEIGNEPDIYDTVYDSGVPLTAADYCSRYMAYATAMKAANAAAGDGGAPPLQFVGPDLAWKYIPGNDWLTPFLDGCKDYVDVVSVHRYPFGAATLSTNGALTDAKAFRASLTALQAIVTAHARPGAPLAVTEANVAYDYDPTKYVGAAAQAAPGTFLAGLWTADTIGVGLENHLWSLAFWNLGEADDTGSVLGFIVGEQPVPAYYAEQLFSSNFRGDVIVPSGIPLGFSVYANHDATAASSAVVVLNKTATASSLSLAVDSLPVASLAFAPMSMTLVQIPDDPAGAVHAWQYTADLAATNLGPKQLQ